MNATTWNAWDWGDDIDVGTGGLIGYSVVARDGEIGKIDEATVTTGTGSIVVDTGPWIFGERVMLPAGVVRAIDHEDERVLVERSKEEIEAAPRFDPQRHSSSSYHDDLAEYYAGWYGASITTGVRPGARSGRNG